MADRLVPADPLALFAQAPVSDSIDGDAPRRTVAETIAALSGSARRALPVREDVLPLLRARLLAVAAEPPPDTP